VRFTLGHQTQGVSHGYTDRFGVAHRFLPTPKTVFGDGLRFVHAAFKPFTLGQLFQRLLEKIRIENYS
jgi:hypothetical protein